MYNNIKNKVEKLGCRILEDKIIDNRLTIICENGHKKSLTTGTILNKYHKIKNDEKMSLCNECNKKPDKEMINKVVKLCDKNNFTFIKYINNKKIEFKCNSCDSVQYTG